MELYSIDKSDMIINWKTMKIQTRNYIIIGILCSALAITLYPILGKDKTMKRASKRASISNFLLDTDSSKPAPGGLPVDFTIAAAISTPEVVHIRAIFISRQQGLQDLPDEFKEFFGDHFNFQPSPKGPQKFEAMGSGVIISANGYIVTNNHVIENAEEINVTLNNKRSYKAIIKGIDPATDLAVLQIDATDLPHIILGNSDETQIGEWVLAVGNPFNLESTVTAGIVSAKGRNIHLLKDNYAIESFIQTDAAVNPGNSGGALVNLKGELVGINTAISSPSGTYAGYAFAIPSSIVKKVTEDIIKYGRVQRGFLGVLIREVNVSLATELNLNVNEGVIVDSLITDGSAIEAGIKKGDVILKIDKNQVKNANELQEVIARSKPGETIRLSIIRSGKAREIDVKLKNRLGNSELLIKKEQDDIFNTLGANFEDLSLDEKKQLGLAEGILITKIYGGKIKAYTDIREGFIITQIDKKPVRSVKELARLLESKKGGVMMEGVYPGYPGIFYYAFGL